MIDEGIVVQDRLSPASDPNRITELLVQCINRLLGLSRTLGMLAIGLSGFTLIIIFLFTATEVTMRFLWRGIPGSWELISFMGGIVVGFAVPRTSQVAEPGHPRVDLLTNRISPLKKKFVHSMTRLISMAFFILIGWSLLSMGIDYRAGMEVSQTMKIPFYPVMFALAAAFLMQAFQFLLDIVKIWRCHE